MSEMGYRGRRGRYPGNGPFRNLPPYQRPGWLYGYGRGMGYGRGYGYYGAGYGRGYGYYGSTSPYSCARFPWLPRWWWADPKYGSSMPYPPAPDTGTELERLQAERAALENSIEEMRRHVEAGTTPATWPTQPFPYYGAGAYAPSPEQEKNLLEGQMTAISSQMEAIKKRLEEIKEGN
jgi:hypothetical protein